MVPVVTWASAASVLITTIRMVSILQMVCIDMMIPFNLKTNCPIQETANHAGVRSQWVKLRNSLSPRL
jgi:hypothetical protein